ncbi:hypothetical protein DFH07DRAFT_779844 [Mycena maculata]|uniref:Peptidase A1 domain-containing protein n=1 Tax=Mycena maculata TaxID=230809 RepID=A0AAD7MWS4_9AGAR|nr:hypothetical protein DFH07DRAFT_779844 [Mycena maculata]
MWCSYNIYSSILVAVFVQRAGAHSVKETRCSPHSPDARAVVSSAVTNGSTTFTLLGNGTEDNEMNTRVSRLFICHLIHLIPTNITVNGRNFKVAIDTGSTDLIATSAVFVFNNTEISVINSYGDGSSHDVSGTIGFASVQLGNYTVNYKGILSLGLDGLMGFSNFLGYSEIQLALRRAKLDETLGEPFLSNIFDQKPEQGNFLAISLSRTNDLEGSSDALFLIRA